MIESGTGIWTWFSKDSRENFVLTLLAQWRNQSPRARESVPRMSDLKEWMKQEMGVSENSVPLNWLMIIIPIKWL